VNRWCAAAVPPNGGGYSCAPDRANDTFTPSSLSTYRLRRRRGVDEYWLTRVSMAGLHSTHLSMRSKLRRARLVASACESLDTRRAARIVARFNVGVAHGSSSTRPLKDQRRLR
jgi:hypothetical protein